MATINIRLDDDVKKDFEKFCSAVGMNMTTAFSLFAKTVIKEQRIPFEISTEPFYSSSNINRLKKAAQDMENKDYEKKRIHALIESESE